VDWSYFGETPLREPFFDDSVQRCLRQPFNRLFRYTTPIDRLPDWLQANRYIEPDGFIFHMSRCGSTLVSQMLAARSDAIAISEAGPIDTVVNARRVQPDLSEEQQALWLRWMISALGQARRGDERRLFVKLDAWHTIDFPLFRRAFPTVPWIFLYREPVEVLVSHLRQPGMHMIPALVSSDRFELNPATCWQAPAEYRARVLARICEPMTQNLAAGGGLLVNYRQLPDAMWALIMPHFGIVPGEGDRAAMTEVSLQNAKAPGMRFTRDSAAKQQEATEATRGLAEMWLCPSYRELEAIRLGG
jgi:gluconate kinase